MIIVPVTITIVTAICCLMLIWTVLGRTTGLSFSDTEEFEQAQGTIAIAVKEVLRGDTDAQIDRLRTLSKLMDSASVSVTILRNGTLFYQYGETNPRDEGLIAAALAMGEGSFLSTTDRSLFTDTLQSKDWTYKLYLFNTPVRYSYTTLKVLFILSLLVLLAVIILSVYLTNLFLTKFVFQKISQPLNILFDGVHQIRDGNLSYRIMYDGKDEFAAVCSDFNEMAQRLKHSVEQTRLHEESHKALIAELSHDLRSPLTSIQAYVSGLLDGVANSADAQKRYLKTIQKKADDIQHMITQMLFFSKMELEEYPMHPEKVAFHEFLTTFFEDARKEYASRGLTITYELCEAQVTLDRAAFERVLANILENSVKYKTDGHIAVQVVLQTDGNGYKLSLSDDGPGVAPLSLPKLFTLFYRENAARQNPHEGSGLGLAIAAKLIERLHGSIHAEPAIPHGLSIIIWLPKEL